MLKILLGYVYEMKLIHLHNDYIANDVYLRNYVILLITREYYHPFKKKK